MPKKNTKKILTDSLIDVEIDSSTESEAMPQHHSEPSIDESAGSVDEEAEKGLAAEEGADANSVEPAELAAMSTENETAQELNSKSPVKTKGKAVTKKEKVKLSKKTKTRSKKYTEAKAHIEPGKLYSLTEAIELVKKVSISKFDGSVEVHLMLSKRKNKSSTESPKGTFVLPHGTGKEKKIILLDESKIEEIAKTKKIDFDVALATPEMMPKVGKIAKILGPKGKMPDPKSGTVTTDPNKTIEEIQSGKVEYRIDAQNHIHQIVGKLSWDSTKLLENATVVISAFPRTKIESAYLAASISPSVLLDLNSF